MKLIEKLNGAKDFFFKNYNPKVKLNVVETAKALGVSRQTIYNWIKELNEGNK